MINISRFLTSSDQGEVLGPDDGSNYCFMSLLPSGKPVMILTEYMENGSLDTFLKVSRRVFFFRDDL